MNNIFTYDTKETYTVETKKYKTVYLVTVSKKTNIKVIVDRKTVKRPRVKPITWEFCMPIDEFEQKMAENTNMSWVLKVCKLKYHNVGQDYYDQYKKGNWGADDRSKDTLTEVLERGDEHLIVQGSAWNDGFIRDINGEILMRNMMFDYIRSGIKSGPGDNDYEYHYDIPKLQKHLDKHRKTTDVVVIEIPYYNSDHNDQKGIEFIFIPQNNKEFRMLVAIKTSWDRDIKIKEILGIEKFRINKEDK